MENQKKLDHDDNPPPENQRCRRTDGKGWRCKNVRSIAHNPTLYCDKHYYSSTSYKRRRKSEAEENQNHKKIIIRRRQHTHHSSDEDKTDDQLRSCSSSSSSEEVRLSGEEVNQKCNVKLEEILGVCKRRCVELLVDLEKKTMECIGIHGKLDELESMKIAAEEELKEFKRRQERRRIENDERVTYLEEELKKMEKGMEHKKSRAEGDVEFWRNKVCDMEATIFRMENGSVESRISEPQGLNNNNGEKEGDNELSKHDAEFTELQTKEKVLNEDEVDLNTHRQVEDKVVECSDMNISSESPNVLCGCQNGEDENGRVDRASMYEYSSEIHLRMRKNLHDEVGNTTAVYSVELVCLTSDDESAGEASKGSSDCSSDSESLGEVMDRMVMNYRNKVKEIKWEFEADMLSSFEEDPKLCMKAVCALYRQQTLEENSAIGLFHHLDALRIKTLAEFLMEDDHKGDLKKSVKELEAFSHKALDDCKRLASRYSKQLFSIYKDKQNPFFLPTSSASH